MTAIGVVEEVVAMARAMVREMVRAMARAAVPTATRCDAAALSTPRTRRR